MKKITTLAATLIILAASSLFTTCESSKKATGTMMKFNLKEGKIYDYDMVWEMDQQIMQQEMKMKMNGNYSLEVTDEKDDIRTIKSTYGKIKMYMNMDDMVIDVDTDKPVTTGNTDETKLSNMMNRMMKAMVGKSFVMKVNAEGKVLEITGIDEILKSMNSSMQDVPDEMRLPMSQMLSQQLDHENMKKMFEQIFFIFPNKHINIGDNWDKTLDMGGMVPMRFNSNYKVKAIEGDFVTLDVSTKILSTSSVLTLEGDQTGVMLVDSKTGLVVNAEFNQDINTTTEGMITKTKAKGNIKGKAR